MPGTDDPIDDPARLGALHDADLLDTPAEEAFDQLARLAARLVDAPMALVSLVGSDRQFFKSVVGVSEALARARGTPIAQSFCRYAVASRAPFVVPDARNHPLVRDNTVIEEHGVVAYLGVPLVNGEGHALGTLCVIDSQPRAWSAQDVETVGALARTVMATIAMRTSARLSGRADARTAATGTTATGATATSHADPPALARAAADYLAAVDRYEAVVVQRASSAEDLEQEEEERHTVGFAFAILADALDRSTAHAASAAPDGRDTAAADDVLRAAVRAFVTAERERQAASTAFLEQRLGLDEFQLACAAVRAPEHAVRQALLEAQMIA
jgi:GAF domain-containing protein